ncbi:carbonic anhydrase [Saccharibacillus sacchari]|uniref:carbonic anhydrase n=1 Tax=Saccharibacillus sacchari TaxID=456493 RepID=UPI0004BBF349|nr:carbonic anhydrase family protein [Saccharibacillus sacchari]
MKRSTFAYTAALVALFALTACGQSTASSTASDPTVESSAAADAPSDAASATPAKADHAPVHWSYETETGPEHWGELESEFESCKIGQSQSPINIDHTKIVQSGQIKPIEAHYGTITDAALVDNGHTIQVNVPNKQAYMLLDGEKYSLLQFHFHHPSEHQIDGQNAEMELHFVHENEQGEKAVVGVLIHPGKANPAIKQLWSQLPESGNEESVILNTPIDLDDLLPENLHAVHYDGSLTTPPCTEQVNWSVLEDPIELSQAQIDLFAERFPDNHRPVQEVGNRVLNGDD